MAKQLECSLAVGESNSGGKTLKIAIISDIHSNLEALRKVLEDAVRQKVNQVYCLGDIVGYGPCPRTCLALVRKYCQIILKGNHEYYVSQADLNDFRLEISENAFQGISFSRRCLLEEELKFLQGLPLARIVSRYDLSLSHASFADPEVWRYLLKEEETRAELRGLQARIGVVGHTHIPYVFGGRRGYLADLAVSQLYANEKFIINAGSVGQPRDEDCRASYGILDYRADRSVEFRLRRVFYDIGKTAEAIEKAGLPLELAERLFRGM